MRELTHFLRCNILYNKIELCFSYGITLIIVFLSFQFKSIDAEMLASVSFYAILYAFMSNKNKLSLKYLISLPLSKAKLAFIKSLSDVVYFVPAIVTGGLALIKKEAGFDFLPLGVLLIQAAAIIGLHLLESDVEGPRMENAKASFLNRLVYIRKYLDVMFLLACAGVVGMVVYSVPISMAVKQYLMIVGLCFVYAFKYRKVLKLMQDESLSYFKFKRDTVRMGLKVATPIMVFVLIGGTSLNPAPYGEKGVFSFIRNGKVEELKAYISKRGVRKALGESGESGFVPLQAAVLEGKEEVAKILIEKFEGSKQLPKITHPSFESYELAHLAAASSNPRIFEVLDTRLELDLNAPLPKTGETPLMIAAKNCGDSMVDYLLQKGSDPNAADRFGRTVLMFSIERGCDASTALLMNAGADPNKKNKEGKSALDMLSEKDSMRYYVERKALRQKPALRGIASEEVPDSELTSN